MMFLVPTPFSHINVVTGSRTRHCRLRRCCIEGSSGSLCFQTAVLVFTHPVWAVAPCKTKVFGTHVVYMVYTHGSIIPMASALVDLPSSRSLRSCILASHCWASQVWMNVMLPSWSVWGAWRTKPWVGRISTVSSGWCGPRCWSWMLCPCRSSTRVSGA